MDRYDALELARQVREHIDYQAPYHGNTDSFDDEIVALVQFVVDECAHVVETTPIHLFGMSKDPRHIIAAAVRGYFKR